MPKKTCIRANAKTAYGQPLDKPIEFDFCYEKLLKGDEIPADEYPDDSDILVMVNTKRAAAARSKAQNAAFEAAEIKKPTLEDPNVALATMIRAMVAQGIPVEQAQQVAKNALGMA